jgi:hypothetical protein
MRSCNACGAVNVETAKFCTSCGQKMSEATTQQTQESPAVAAPEPIPVSDTPNVFDTPIVNDYKMTFDTPSVESTVKFERDTPFIQLNDTYKLDDTYDSAPTSEFVKPTQPSPIPPQPQVTYAPPPPFPQPQTYMNPQPQPYPQQTLPTYIQQPVPAPSQPMYAPPPPPAYQMPYNRQPPLYGNMYAATAASPLVSSLKKVLSSPLAILVTVGMFLMFLLNLINEVVVGASTYAYRPDLAASTVVVMVPSFALSLLMAIGLLVTLVSASQKNTPMKTSGITILQGCAITYLVFLSILAFFILIAGIILIATMPSGDFSYEFISPYDYPFLDMQAINLIIAILFIVAAIVLVLAFIYIIKLMGFFKDLKTSFTDGRPRTVSMYIPVINFIIAGCQVVVLFPLLFAFGQGINGMAILLNIVNGTLMILSGVLILQIRKQMNIHFKQQF